MKRCTYHSSFEKTKEHAHYYEQTHGSPHRFLAYKDIPALIQEYVKGKQALDYGSGTGASSAFLQSLSFHVIGADISLSMLEKAKATFPEIEFKHIDNLATTLTFDLVFSSFVLFELPSKEAIIEYLKKARSFLNTDGVFIGITGSEHLYSPLRKWLSFDVNFEENHPLISGKIVKLALKDPRMEFYDYYWEEKDYVECFHKAGLHILQTHFPLGSPNDPYLWNDERSYAPFTVFIAKRA